MSAFGLSMLLVTGIVLLVASLPIVRLTGDPDRALDHVARSLVALSVGLVSVSAALYQFEQNSQRSDRQRDEQQRQVEQERQSRQEAADRQREDQLRLVEQERRSRQEAADRQRNEQETRALEQDRRTASLSFGRAMILYALSQAQLDRVLTSCAPVASGVITDKVGCRESGTLAIKFSSLLPSVDSTYSQVARGLTNFKAAGEVIRTNLVDSEASLKGLMPASVEILMQATAGPPRVESVFRAREFVDDFQERANEISTIYCAFAAATEESWTKFSEVISQFQDIKYVTDTKGSSNRLTMFRKVSKDMKVGAVSCNDVPAGVIDLVPAGRGGN